MTVLVDMDSTVVEIFERWLGEYNDKTGDNLTVEELTTWHTHDHARHGRRIYEPLQRKGFFRNLPAIPGAIESLEILARDHDVIMTSAAMYPSNFSEKVEWARENLPFIPVSNIALLSKKHLLRADVLIDDGPHIVELFSKTNPKAFIAGIEHPYNVAAREFFDILAPSWRKPVVAWNSILEGTLQHLAALEGRPWEPR
jgi:5'(3')-deoxyribonucleotidase